MTGDEWVRVNGELWRAHGAAAGEQVRVRAVDGLTLDVEPLVPGSRSVPGTAFRNA